MWDAESGVYEGIAATGYPALFLAPLPLRVGHAKMGQTWYTRTPGRRAQKDIWYDDRSVMVSTVTGVHQSEGTIYGCTGNVPARAYW